MQGMSKTQMQRRRKSFKLPCRKSQVVEGRIVASMLSRELRPWLCYSSRLAIHESLFAFSAGTDNFVVNLEDCHIAPRRLSWACSPDLTIFTDRVFVAQPSRVCYYSYDADALGSFYSGEFLSSLTIHRDLLVSTVPAGISFSTMEGKHLKTWPVDTPLFSRVILHNDLIYALHSNRVSLNVYRQDGHLVNHWQPEISGHSFDYRRFAFHGNYVYLDAKTQCVVGDLRRAGVVTSWPFLEGDIYDMVFYNDMLVTVGKRVCFLK